jgi:hypothetical protein
MWRREMGTQSLWFLPILSYEVIIWYFTYLSILNYKGSWLEWTKKQESSSWKLIVSLVSFEVFIVAYVKYTCVILFASVTGRILVESMLSQTLRSLTRSSATCLLCFSQHASAARRASPFFVSRTHINHERRYSTPAPRVNERFEVLHLSIRTKLHFNPTALCLCHITMK